MSAAITIRSNRPAIEARGVKLSRGGGDIANYYAAAAAVAGCLFV